MAKSANEASRVPRSLVAAWGKDERPGRGPKPALTLERIVAAGVAVADREGLDAVSMSRVAKELGASTMALYRYVDAKDELLQLMVDAVYGPPPSPAGDGEPIRAALGRWAWAELAVCRAHPWVLRVPLNGPPITPNAVRWFESGLESLRDTRLSENEKMESVLLLSVYVRGIETVMREVREAFLHAAGTDEEAMAGYEQSLVHLIDGQDFPALQRAIASGVIGAEDEPDEEFTFGLERILDGIDSYVSRRATDSAQAQ